MLPKIDQAIFHKNLLITQAYCELQLQKPFETNAKVLRTINPEIRGRSLFSYTAIADGKRSFADKLQSKPTNTKDWVTWSIDPLNNFDPIGYNEIFELQLSLKFASLPSVDIDKIYYGRILVVHIDQHIPDGASSSECDCFIDDYDCPPIDTWFYLMRENYSRILFAWIPERFVDTVQDAIDVNVLDIFNWYSEGASLKYQHSLD